jgi:hypothetical protein
MIIPTVINYVIDSNYVSCFAFDNNGTKREYEFTSSREDFDNEFRDLVELPANMIHLSYEPYNNLYCISTMEESGPVVTSYTSNNFPKPIQDLVTMRRDIYKWLYDCVNSKTPPSKYHTYDTVAHQWQITEENARLLVQDNIVTAVQNKLNTFAQTRNYDNMLSACTYATSVVPKFAAEGQYCVEARDLTWSALYAIFAEVAAGTRPALTAYTDVEAELPVLEWPGI